jgi:hypothetical protein
VALSTSPRQVAVRLFTRFTARHCHVTAAMLGDAFAGLGGRLRIELVTGDTGAVGGQSSGPATVVLRRTLRRLVPGATAEVRIPLARIPQGAWCLRPTFIDRHGRACHTQVLQTVQPDRPEWFGSPAGVSRTVPPPWSPLRTEVTRDGYRVRCWGREYSLAPGTLLAQVLALGDALLGSPVRFTGRADGRTLQWERPALSCLDQAPDQAVFGQEMSCGPLRFQAQTEVEFDGMLRFDCCLTATTAITLQQLTLEVPLRAAAARLFYQWRGKYCCGDDRWIGVLPRRPLRKGFRPFVWLGDERRGLAWFAESDQHWFPADPQRAVQIVPEGDAVVLRLNLVSTPVRLVGHPTAPITDRRPVALPALRYTFGLQATPVKPVARDAWDYRCFCLQQNTPGTGGQLRLPRALLDRLEGAGVRTVIVFEHWTDWEAHYVTRHRRALERIVRDCHARGMQVLLYFGFLLSERAPEFPRFGETALVQPRTGWSIYNYPPQPVQSAWRVCLNSAWQDFVPHGIAQALAELGADGVYLDGTAHAYACRNLTHGCGVLRPDGTVSPTFPIFAVRSAMRRLYSSVKAARPDGQVNTHNSSDMVIPALGFSTSTWDGEQFAGLKAGTPAAQFLPLAAFRTEFMGRQWGVPAELLCYVGQPLTFRQAWALALLHDVPVRAMLGRDPADLDLNAAIWRAMDAFDRRGARFRGYWENAEEVQVTPRSSRVSLYEHPSHGWLLVVVNLANREQTVRVTLAGVAGRQVTASEVLAGQPCPCRGQTMHLALGPLDFALVHVGRRSVP